MRGCAERAPESRGRGVEGLRVRVGEMLRKPRQTWDAGNLACHVAHLERRVFPRRRRQHNYAMALQALKSRRRSDYSFQLEYRTRWCVSCLCALFSTNNRKERQ
jgi:hypothetical protein